jgi:hypothetical protein
MKTKILPAAAFFALMSCVTPISEGRSEHSTPEQSPEQSPERTPTESVIQDEVSDLLPSQLEYASENQVFELGYAGLFTQEDLNGKTIGGYEINPPRMMRPFYAPDLHEYFSTFPDVRNFYRSLTDDLEERGLERFDPFLEEDASYREMILADDSLTVDQQLELIIKNHQGYLLNLDIDDLVEQKFGTIYTDYEEVIDDVISRFGYSDPWEAIHQQAVPDFAQYLGWYQNQPNGLNHERRYVFTVAETLTGLYFRGGLDHYVMYGDDMVFGYDDDQPYIEEFMVKVARAYEILNHRIPALAPYLIGTEGERFTGISMNMPDGLIISGPIETSDDSRYEVNNIRVGPQFLNRIVDYYEGTEEEQHVADMFLHERMVTSFFHEFLHNAYTTEHLSALDINQEALDNAIVLQGGSRNTSSYEGIRADRPSYSYELINSLHNIHVAELLNVTPFGLYSTTGSLRLYLERGREEGHVFEEDPIFDLIEYDLYQDE